jgi:SAGA-associated factor 11
MNDFVSEISMEVIFELHRAVKLGYYRELIDPDSKNVVRREIVTTPGLDVFGHTHHELKETKVCVCPRCDSSISVHKFAPHLEKCLGIGRNSSRLATKRPPVIFDSDSTTDDDGDYVPENKFPPKKSKKDIVKDKEKEKEPKDKEKDKLPSLTSSPRRSNKQPPPSVSESVLPDSDKIKPSTLQHTEASFVLLSQEQKKSLIGQICGVVSERTKRLCTRSVNCPQHTEEQRKEIRLRLMSSSAKSSSSLLSKRKNSVASIDEDDILDPKEQDSQPPPKKSNWETSSTASTTSHASSVHHKEEKSKTKKSKKGSEKKKTKKSDKLRTTRDRDPPSDKSPSPSRHSNKQGVPSMPDMPLLM